MNSVFIHNPKTGGLTIQEALRLEVYRFPHRVQGFKQKGNITFGHLDYKKLVANGHVSKEFDQSAFKYGFVRNPYDRAVSHYFYVKDHHPDILPKDMGFEDFTQNVGQYDKTFKHQYRYLEGIKLDLIGRFERLEEDIREIARVIGVEVGTIPVLNRSKHKPYTEYYTKKSRKNIYEYYKKDFKLYGYSHRLFPIL